MAETVLHQLLTAYTGTAFVAYSKLSTLSFSSRAFTTISHAQKETTTTVSKCRLERGKAV